MKWIRKIAKNVDDIIGLVSLGLVVIVVFINVISRYIFDNPLTWSDELATALFVWCIFIGSSVCAKYGSHISIDIMVDIMPKKVRKILDIFGKLLVLAFNVYLTHLSYQFAIAAGMKRTPTLKISYTLIDISATIGFGLMVIYGIIDLWKFIKSDQTKNEDALAEN